MSEPTVRRWRTVGESNGAEERTRTSTGLLPLAPQASASANSATPALSKIENLVFFAPDYFPTTFSSAVPLDSLSRQ